LEIEIDLRHWKLHLLLAVSIGLLGCGVYSWHELRWDKPWLRPLGRDMVVVRFDGLQHSDKAFKVLMDAFFLTTYGKPVVHGRPVIHGFQPDDLTYDSTSGLSRYAWVVMVGYMTAEDQRTNLNAFKAEVAAALQQTGIKVSWRFALVRRDGSVTYPD